MKHLKASAVYEMPAQEYNHKLANILKNMPEFKQPEWSYFVKSSVSKVRPPKNPDFWFMRAASILRQFYTHNVVGVNRLKTRYSGRKKRGVKPEYVYKASGKIIRTILQQSEKAGFLEKFNEAGKRAGRKLTEKGKELLEGVK